MNENLRNHIKAVIKDLTRMSHKSIYLQEYTIQNFVSLTGMADKSSKLPTRPGNQTTQHTTQAIRGNSEQNSSRGDDRKSTRTTANETSRPMSRLLPPTNNHINEVARPVEKQDTKIPTRFTSQAIGGSSKQSSSRRDGQNSTNTNANEASRPMSRLLPPTNNRIYEVARPGREPKLQLTSEEREALISLILTNELRSKVEAQEKEIFSSPPPNDLAPRKTPTISERTLIFKIQQEIESLRAAQEREIFGSPSPPIANVQEDVSHKTIIPHSPERTRRVTDVQQSVNPLAPNTHRKRKPKISLASIPEVDEVPEPIRNNGVLSEHDEKRKQKDFNRNSENTQIVKNIKAHENIRQQRMESELPNGLIHDISESILVRSDDSDSLNELVIKDFDIRVNQSEPDAFLSESSIIEKAMIESRKLSNVIESLKYRFQIKVARDKINAPYLPTQQKVIKNIPSARKTQKNQAGTKYIDTNPYTEASEIHSKVNENNQSTRKGLKTPVNIMDSHNWGGIALPEPIPFHRSKGSSSDEDFLNEKYMQYDDVFGPDNVLPPPASTKENNHTFQQNNDKVNQTLQGTKVTEMQNIQNIEDFESPRISEVPSDESDQHKATSKRLDETKLDGSENIGSMKHPQFVDTKLANSSATKRSNQQIETQLVIEQPQNQTVSSETQHQKDIKKLAELLGSGALSSSLVDQIFEEFVLDLLLRQSDSLWDPVVRGIPITYFIPSQNHGRSLLDTSITDDNLDQPLISEPHKKLPKYMESLEKECRLKTENDNVHRSINGVNHSSVRDESPLIHGLPKFSYKPAAQYLYRRKVHNIMDGEDEPQDSDDILEEHEMNFEDLVKNVAEPVYDFTVEPKKHSSVASEKRQHNLKQHEIESATRDIFDVNHDSFKTLFGIDDIELNSKKNVPTSDIELIYNQESSFGSRIIRNAVNCPYHLRLMKSIYKKIKKYMTQPSQPVSSRNYDYLEEIMKRFNIIRDGRICARLKSCPKDDNISKKSSAKRDKSPNEINTSQPTEDKLQLKNTDKPLQKENQHKHEPNQLGNVRKLVSFAQSPQRYSTSKTRQTSAKKFPNTFSRNTGISGSSKASPIMSPSGRKKVFTKTRSRSRHRSSQ